MRLWMINPRMLCRQHLLGEHNELHRFLPSFRKGHKVHGRFHPVVQIQFQGYQQRHDDLAVEMERRRYNHNSPLVGVPDFKAIYPEYWDFKVDIYKSYNDLMDRCSECRKLIKNYWRTGGRLTQERRNGGKMPLLDEDKKTYFRLSPELGDGVHMQIVDKKCMVDAIELWADEVLYGSFIGENVVIETVEMTEEEFNALPEI